MRLACSSISIAFIKWGAYSDISDDDLDRITREAQRQHPGIGIRMLKGYLRSKALRVQWERVGQSLLRTDPTGVHQRWRDSIRRRKYWVPGPLALWHIDGNHKLIRWEKRATWWIKYTAHINVSIKSMYIYFFSLWLLSKLWSDYQCICPLGPHRMAYLRVSAYKNRPKSPINGTSQKIDFACILPIERS